MAGPYMTNHWLRGQKTEDPLRHIFLKRLIVYLIFLPMFVLYPFDLFQPNHVSWLKTPPGIQFTGNGIVKSPEPPQSLVETLLRGDGLSLEAWLATDALSQAGPARIISYSYNTSLRNFTLGQDRQHLVMRLRTTRTDPNGVTPHLVVKDVFGSTERLHVVVTYNWEKQIVYINGRKRGEATLPGGKIANWDPGYHFFLGNEGTADRPWKGRLYRVSLYDHPLEESEVVNLFQAGCSGDTSEQMIKPPVAEYRFAEGDGRLIRDRSPSGGATHLEIPGYLHDFAAPFLRWPREAFLKTYRHSDTPFNIIGFLPLGFFLHGMLRNRYGLSWRLSLSVCVIGFLTSFSFETLQHFSIRRDSSALDILNNTFGAVLGVFIDRTYIRHVRYYWDSRQAEKAFRA